MSSLLVCSTVACVALLASLWTAGLGPGTTRAERLTDFVLACCAVASLLVEALGYVGWFKPWPLLAATWLGGGVSFACGAGRELVARIEDMRAAIGAVRRSATLMLTCALGVALTVRALSLREVSWDGLLYHLTYPAIWLQRGAISSFEAPGIWEQYESFPKSGEALFALAMLPFGTDALTYFVLPPLWLATGVAIRATAVRLGANRHTADTVVLCALACPGLAGYVAPANVEVPVAFACCASIAAASRALVARDPRALASLWLALCFGAAVKITNLAYLPLGVLVTLSCMRSQPMAACATWSLRGLALGLTVMLPWYVENVLRCGNPLYPAGLPWAEGGAAAGTVANARALHESSVITQRTLFETFEALAHAPWNVRYLGPGWSLLWLAPVCALSAILAARRARRSLQLTASLVLAALAFGMGLLYVITPWNGVFYEANTRFLMLALIAALLSACASTSLLAQPLSAAAWRLTALVTLVTLVMPRFWRGVTWVGLPGAIVLGTWIAFASSGRWFRTQRAATVARGLGLTFTALSVALYAASWSERKAATYARGFTGDGALAQLWRAVDALPPGRIAYVVGGGADANEGWSFYPLFGASLQHRVRYVDTERVASPACQRRGLIRDQPDARSWLERLGELHIDYVVCSGQPYELQWIESRRDAFEALFQLESQAIYRVRASALQNDPRERSARRTISTAP